jgi:hypothetical protein
MSNGERQQILDAPKVAFRQPEALVLEHAGNYAWEIRPLPLTRNGLP